MKVLVVADSAYGNTWQAAEAIAEVFGDGTHAVRPEQIQAPDLQGVDLLIAGSPTQGGRPLPSVTAFLKRLPRETTRGLQYAAFDTRVDEREQNFALKTLLKVIGYAAPKMARELSGRGAQQLVPPEGFIVDEKEGPLREGELERAKEWARRVQAVTAR